MASNPSSSAAGAAGSWFGGGHGGASLEDLALGKVAEAADSVAAASSAGEVVRAIHAVAALVFPVDSAAVAGTVDEPFRSEIINGVSLSDDERESWRHAFYHGPAFPTISKILLGHVALKWLRQIHASARKEVYDSFFVKGSPTEVIQALVPALSHKEGSKEDHNTTCSNIERLLILCLVENKGISQIIAEFTVSNKHDDDNLNLGRATFISRVAQLLSFQGRQKALIALLVTCTFESLDVFTKLLYSSSVAVSQRILIIDVITEAAQELAETKIVRREVRHGNLISDTSPSWLVPSDRGPPRAGPWREVSESGTLLNWSHRYEREVPSRSGQVKSGKSWK